MNSKEYSASLVSQQFWFQEMIKTVEFIRTGITGDELKKKIVDENLYMLTAQDRRVRAFGCIKRRMKEIGEEISSMLPEMELTSAKIVNLIAIMKTDLLFFEFVYEVYREKRILGDKVLEQGSIDRFFESKIEISETLQKRSESAIKKLKQCYVKLLCEAGLLTDTKTRELAPVLLNYRTEELLNNAGLEQYVKAVKGVG